MGGVPRLGNRLDSCEGIEQKEWRDFRIIEDKRMCDTPRTAIEEILEDPEISLNKFERHVLQSIRKKNIISRDTRREFFDSRTLGERLADGVAQFGGSWTFIIIFVCFLIVWIVLNSFLSLKWGKEGFDPYPYILLNLFLSMTAAVQAPLIMMSQNRQAAQDRLQAKNDYEVNLKAELEIQRLHEKLDELHKGEWQDLKELQERQLGFLERLLSESEVMNRGRTKQTN
jgi:uncharacterized membrane protein